MDERIVYRNSSLCFKSEVMRYTLYMESLRDKFDTYLYPHDTDNFILIVPRIFKSKTVYDAMLKSPLMLVWVPVAAILPMIRFIFNKIRKTDKKLVDISLQTFGLSLGMSFSAVISSAAENFLLWCFCLGTMLSGMLLSSEMFQGFALQLNILKISNLEELQMSRIEVKAPTHSESVEHFFNNIPQKLKLDFITSYEISDMIQSRNTKYAYAIRESKFNVLFSKDKDAWHRLRTLLHDDLNETSGENTCLSKSSRKTKCPKTQVYEAAALDLNTERVRYGNYRGISRFKDYTNLYPHDTDNFILIVPKIFKSKTEYSQILKSPLIYVWTPTVAIVAIIRFIFNKIRKTDKKLVDISLETFGLSLGMSFSAAISSAAENCLLWFFCLGTMLSGMLLSSSMFQGFTLQLDHLTINNLKQLEASGLTVYLPIYVESKLKLKYMISYEISDMIQYRNTEGAYVINERKFNILFGNDKDVWHVIERFGTEHLSYRLRLFSSLEDRMNTMVQRCINHGIIKYLIDKNKRLITGIKPSGHFKEREVISSNVEPLSLSDMRNSFLLGALGKREPIEVHVK
ncbi:hypothetical protein Bhyg_08839 [Pseudolycoriella hygida]|uniref:Uncharacterized protein n=1 Tax=Pseudolycoriella hygida TaxID=35572 RepID=A0A9Q0S3X8_9DIPT|nr:hypothetical protein Bhyg_08839 [Pseudolycoriella hygida]